MKKITLILAIAAITLVSVLPAFAKSNNKMVTEDSVLQQSPVTPVSPFVVQGACPFEGCQYGTWTARAPVRLHAKVNGALLKRQIQKGERVMTLSGEVHAIPRKGTVTKVYKSDEEQGIHIGSIVYFLYPLGEGAAKVWHEGKAKDGSMDMALQFESADTVSKTWVWWVKVRMRDGTIGWLKNPSGFEGMDRFS